jgi:exopolysaccharide biosynthesis WecB/TagA/CpsF family protein
MGARAVPDAAFDGIAAERAARPKAGQREGATMMSAVDDDEDVLLLDRRSPSRTVDFLDVSFAPMDPATLERRVVEAASRTDRFRYVVTPNVDHLVRLHEDPSLSPLYERAWANVCDSRILELLAGWSGLRLPAAPGSDLAAALFERAIDPAEPVVIIGADAAVIEALKARFGLKDVRWHAPPMGLRDNPEAIAAAAAFAAANPARFHFLCVGSPQQEMVARAILNRGDAVGMGLCLGASLDFLAGKTARAPMWMRRLRLEWLHRLASEPERMWKRYLVEGPRIFKLWRTWERRTGLRG